MRIWHLELSSFSGIVAGAMHYWAKLISPESERHEVERVLSAQDIGDGDDENGEWYHYEPGDTTERFNTCDDAIAAGIALFGKLAQPGDVLLRGLSASLSPQEPLCGPSDAVTELTRIWERWELLEGYDGGAMHDADTRRVIVDLDDEWWALTHA